MESVQPRCKALQGSFVWRFQPAVAQQQECTNEVTAVATVRFAVFSKSGPRTMWETSKQSSRTLPPHDLKGTLMCVIQEAAAAGGSTPVVWDVWCEPPWFSYEHAGAAGCTKTTYMKTSREINIVLALYLASLVARSSRKCLYTLYSSKKNKIDDVARSNSITLRSLTSHKLPQCLFLILNSSKAAASRWN